MGKGRNGGPTVLVLTLRRNLGAGIGIAVALGLVNDLISPQWTFSVEVTQVLLMVAALLGVAKGLRWLLPWHDRRRYVGHSARLLGLPAIGAVVVMAATLSMIDQWTLVYKNQGGALAATSPVFSTIQHGLGLTPIYPGTDEPEPIPLAGY